MNVIEEKILKYQECGLFLNQHNFDLSQKIQTIFEDILINYPFAVIFEVAVFMKFQSMTRIAMKFMMVKWVI